MTRLFQNIVDNPILMRELRRRMRGKALVYSIITYIMVMAIVTVGILLLYSPPPWANLSQAMLKELQSTGLMIFRGVSGIQMLLVLIIAPTITAGVTTGEKERKTFDFLRVTTITRWMYILGCFLSTAFYVGLALLCALPLISLTFLYGGISLEDVVKMFFFLLGTSCVLSSFGLYISSVTERTRTAQGIVVFMIFGLIFGGFFLYQQYAFFFGSTAAVGTGGTAAPSSFFIFNVGIPTWSIGVLGMIGISWVFLLLAARKLFEPEDTRAFSHWQFALLFAIILGGFIGLLSANPFTKEVPEISFLVSGYLMLLVAVQCFAVGRMEVGDEIWHLKRHLPMLRPLDQTIPYLAALGLIWYIVLSSYGSFVKTPLLPLGLVKSFLLTSLSSYAFFVFLARGVMGITGSRRKAAATTLVVALSLLVGFPIIIASMATLINVRSFWQECFAISPIASLVDGFISPKDYPLTGTGKLVGIPATILYAVGAAGLAIYGEARRYKRWKNFDYHYDMPAG
ncbi:ABC transporter permease [Candidatus Sumerlaeota bacterium]|nr:ABC transporter permease [Candidatus Sumerlaeota bacterium]